MLETAIVGGGLCGLALARGLRARGLAFTLFDARGRLGGRILSMPLAQGRMHADLGAAWFWPGTQPLVTRLISDLGLESFAQHDEGGVLYLRDPDKRPDVAMDGPVHAGARRIEGGMERLVAALAAGLESESVQLGHALVALRDNGDHIILEFQSGGNIVTVPARKAVLAIPPRLLEEHVRFDPPLEPALKTVMRDTQTWMADAAKVIVAYDKAVWRDAGQAGNAFVTHEQAVLGEIFDACGPAPDLAALGGFLALSPDQRTDFTTGLPLLIESQMAQVFGTALPEGEQHYQDWSQEPFTCASLDRLQPRVDQTGFGNPLLRSMLWGGKLHLGGSETASNGAGYLEGAIGAARRLEQSLARVLPAARTAGDAARGPEDPNAASLAAFGAWVEDQRQQAFESYRQRLHRGLSSNQRDQLTQRAVLGAMEEAYGNALAMLDTLPFETASVAIEQGRCALMPNVQAPFGPFMKMLMEDVVAFNRTSCALSNFPEEHRLSTEYEHVILRDIAAAWREFSLNANSLLLAKTNRAPGIR
jgi:monoamine oxidase